MTDQKYYCRICGKEISKEQYEEHNELCQFDEDNEEDEEDFDFIGEDLGF